jgi:prophage antirepressor-like protein
MNSENTNNQIQLDNTNSHNLLVKQFKGLNIQVYGTYEEPLFKAKDIGDLLEMSNIREVIKNFNNKQRCVSLTDTAFGKKEITFLTEQGLYKVLMRSRKKIAEQFQDWVCEVVEEIRKKGKYDLEEKLKEHQQLLQIKELEHQRTRQELIKYKEKTYEEIEKTGHIYVIKTDGGTKVGKTKDTVNKRIRGLQTGNVNNIEILLDFKTSNPDLLEKCAHYILDRYRCNSNREFFDCDINYIKTIVEICGNVINTLKSTYQHISKDEIVEKLKSNGVKTDVTGKFENKSDSYESDKQDDSNFYNWLEENIVYKENSLLQTKDVCELYLGKSNIYSKELSNFKKEIERWIKGKYRDKRVQWEYSTVRIGDKSYKGWKDFKICVETL